MKIKESSFAGFIDGYQSRNIAYIENNFHYKIIDIKETLLWLRQELRDNQQTNNPLRGHLESICEVGYDKNYNNLLGQLFKIGEFISLNITSLNEFKNTPDQRIYTKIKIMIFNFVELAKLSDEPKLINMAIEIGARFQY